jgi:uncharacterized protein with von Willebrand factor type A (vWA) domain
MEANKFERFIRFGAIGDEATRKKIVENLWNALTQSSGYSIPEDTSHSHNFTPAIKQIISHSALRELCFKSPELREQIIQEILDFINASQRRLNKIQSPFEEEVELLQEFNNIPKTKAEFLVKWKKIKNFLSKNYATQKINTDFYEKEFLKSLVANTNKDGKNTTNFESVKEHLAENWEKLLFQKQTQWELEQIDTWRKKFCEELYKRIEELKKLQEALDPFTEFLGRLWDMSKGNWQRVNFDVLQKYSELLKRDKSLQQLAEMLGRMQQAEKEYEEEEFTNIQIKTEWKTEHASKEDLIGVHESDDLNSLLPSEVALLSDEDTEWLFYKKFVEKKLQTFEYLSRLLAYKEEDFQDKRRKEKEDKKGPFIICVDTSGSMHGTPETIAKVLCFAILKIAIRNNRKCYLISFSTGIQTLDLTDLKNSLDKIVNFLCMSFHGGTDAIPAVREALRMLATEDYKKADVIMISDFIMSGFDPQTKQQILQAKENKTKFHSLVIGSSQNQAVVQEFDSHWMCDPDKSKHTIHLTKNIQQF